MGDPQVVKLAGDAGFLCVSKDTTGVEDDLGQVMDHQQHQGEPGES